MRRSAAVCACAVALAGPVSATAQARLDFKGIPFGAGEAAVHKHGSTWCRADPYGIGDRLCMWEDPRQRTYAGEYAPVMDLRFIAGRFDSVMMKFHTVESFAPVRDALQARHGAGECVYPGEGRASCVWNVGGDAAILMARAGELHLVIESREGRPERLARQRKRAASGRRDI